MKDFTKLSVWQKAHQMTLKVYAATRGFPREELYGLISQLRRSCASIPANIAEGCGRSGDQEFARFAQIAAGSASELQYHLLLSRDLGFLNDRCYLPLQANVIEIKRMLAALIRKLKSDR
jgi:four helix bundle protein